MSVLSPTPGEFWDRVTVLNLKLMNAPPGMDVSHWEREREALSKECVKYRIPNQKAIMNLQEVNRLIWDGIDQMNAVQVETGLFTPDKISDSECRRLAELGVNIQRWNAQRMVLREAIDRDAGRFQGPEKTTHVHDKEVMPGMPAGKLENSA